MTQLPGADQRAAALSLMRRMIERLAPEPRYARPGPSVARENRGLISCLREVGTL